MIIRYIVSKSQSKKEKKTSLLSFIIAMCQTDFESNVLSSIHDTIERLSNLLSCDCHQ